MRTKDIFIIGFMLFAMFFGAGNLIFPPALGFQSGEFFWPAILGFILTGVGLPLLSVIVGSISEHGYKESLNKIHPLYSIIFLVMIYLTIGPFFAIPRTATTAYEMGVVPFLNQSNGLSLFIFSVLFFLLVLWIALSPANLSNSIGKYLTPTLLVVILLLIFRALIMYWTNTPQTTAVAFTSEIPFIKGFTEGYLTMDAIGAIAFSIIVLNSIRSLGITNKKDLLIGTIKSAVLAAALLGSIYGGLGWISNRVALSTVFPANQNAGTFLLQYISNEAFGSFGIMLLGVIVFLACLTTATGLIAAVSEYFNSLIPSISYKTFAIIFTLISLVLANQGLDQVIETSVPILSIIYPISISTVLLIAFAFFVPSPRISLLLPLLLITVESLLSVAHKSDWLTLSWIEYLPLYGYQLEWVPLLIVGCIAGYLAGWKQPRINY
ncbi:branched-chain amino acid transport system II carrier protein [Desemzia sp. RIT804]|uniref:branched-chain amino acid transport system II carrier protein n=1 Tax=Desemzia sp. RIT 804 TaxID=2810209 RepID=UPI00194DDBC4|nr:branched-chain amino acid transport system II carrier protein [Desemzia sp. RIT 804]MBM6615760.1 branched-chain amino acid transport system II carrier protein [Desemzia sp. RIT 804]